jgi:hypothetical protein
MENGFSFLEEPPHSLIRTCVFHGLMNGVTFVGKERTDGFLINFIQTLHPICQALEREKR